MPFKPGEGRPGFNISETQIRYAMENSKSCLEAARFLKISYETFRKYSSLFKDEATSKTLFELHKNQKGIGIKKGSAPKMRGNHGLLDILEGKPRDVNHHNLKSRLLRNSIFEEKCNTCGFEERRITDYTVPLLLDWIDGDKTNHKRENLRMLCYNCYYLEVGNPCGGSMKKHDGY